MVTFPTCTNNNPSRSLPRLSSVLYVPFRSLPPLSLPPFVLSLLQVPTLRYSVFVFPPVFDRPRTSNLSLTKPQSYHLWFLSDPDGLLYGPDLHPHSFSYLHRILTTHSNCGCSLSLVRRLGEGRTSRTGRVLGRVRYTLQGTNSLTLDVCVCTWLVDHKGNYLKVFDLYEHFGRGASYSVCTRREVPGRSQG